MPIFKSKFLQPCGRIFCQQMVLVLALAFSIGGCVKPLGPAVPIPTIEPVIEVEEPTILETPRPTQTPKPTATYTPQPTRTPKPTATPTIEATPTCASGEIIEGSYASSIEGPTRSYRIYLPPCYQDDGRVYPSIYLLHGNLRGDEEFSELGLLDSAETLIAENEMPPTIIIMPDGRNVSDNTSGGDGSYEQVVIDELLPHIEQTYCIALDRNLRAIGGISRGGYWAFEIALRHPDKFSIVGGHSPAFFDSSEDPTINPILADIEDNGLRMRIDFGQEDPYRTRANILSRNMTSNGIPHAFIIYPDGGHDDAYWMAQLPAYLRWYSDDWSQNRTSYDRCKLDDSAE